VKAMGAAGATRGTPDSSGRAYGGTQAGTAPEHL
jgi:hypothetical protein